MLPLVRFIIKTVLYLSYFIIYPLAVKCNSPRRKMLNPRRWNYMSGNLCIDMLSYSRSYAFFYLKSLSFHFIISSLSLKDDWCLISYCLSSSLRDVGGLILYTILISIVSINSYLLWLWLFTPYQFTIVKVAPCSIIWWWALSYQKSSKNHSSSTLLTGLL